MKKYKEELIALIVFIFYLFISKFESPIILILFGKTKPWITSLIYIIFDLVILITLIYIYLKKINLDLKDFRKNYKNYINKYFKYWILILGLMFLSNLIISSITKIETSTNQQAIIQLLGKMPIYTIITTILIAPITEELIFRLNLRKIFKSNILYIIVSGLVFGFLHMSVATSYLELLYIIPYSIPGFIFAYLMVKEDNIFIPMSMHMFHNTVLLILELLIIFIK